MRSQPRAKIGRNDPCPCGSGRKYKHCCLASQGAIDRAWERQHEESGGLVGEVMRFAGRGMAVEDVLTGEETEVIERTASRTARSGDILYAQIWQEPELAVLGCCAPLCIPPKKKVEVIELRKKLRKKIAKQHRDLTKDDLLRYADTIRETYLDIRDVMHTPPRFTNTDDQPLHFHTLTFRLGSVAPAFQALPPL